jgi:hypothetical protein
MLKRGASADQVVLEQQRLGLGANDGGLHAGDARDHVAVQIAPSLPAWRLVK